MRNDKNGVGSMDSSSKGDKDSFRGPQACKLVKITYRQLDYWARTGLVVPSVEDANGSGSQRLYSFQDLLWLKLVKRLLDAGLSLPAIRQALAKTKSVLDTDSKGSSYLVVSHESVALLALDVLIERLGAGLSDAVVVVPYNTMIRELEVDISRLKERSPQEVQPSLFEPMPKAV
ncbi:MerR HTH family regulatory protein [Ferrithrix thermotolerans DSM 19514]|jgi:DNA-binding transcriptional MerR regulator|uniref:MerR HTH family regulatory protein n=1 Tax=Ferrithrix thermotolerans DSM 19514 TaxID=1121881 RepID=A0A1M4UFI7_9ACTN|nr:MerR family transcriptional regulator [Ferrithrix thermotolerans]SHE55529.1 MerR HTH family regulatory protein [Ferrithrix thermotolerans DSM 19514]